MPRNPSAGVGVGMSPNILCPMEHDLKKLRQNMQILIFNLLQQRQPSPVDAESKAKFLDVAGRLEEGLFKMANSKEDYLNRATLKSRITSLIKERHGRTNNNNNQSSNNANPSSSVGRMIPTPGLSPSPDGSIVGSNNNNNTSLDVNMTSSIMGSHTSTSLMIPTPGFVNSGGFSAETTMVSQSQQQQRLDTVGQSSQMLFKSNQTRLGMQPKSASEANNFVSGVAAEATMVSPFQQQQRHDPSGQNSRMLSKSNQTRLEMQPKTADVANNSVSETGIAQRQDTSAQISHMLSKSNQTWLEMQPKAAAEANDSVNIGVGANKKVVETNNFPRSGKQGRFSFLFPQQHRVMSNGDPGEAKAASDMVTNVQRETGTENHSEAMHSEPFQFSQFQSSQQIQQMPPPQSRGSKGLPSEHNVLHERTTGMDESQPNSTDGNVRRDLNIRNQQKWLLFVLHARTCKLPEGKCSDRNCVTVQKLWIHVNSCVESHCVHHRCRLTKALFGHYMNCKDLRCPLCVPVRAHYQQHDSGYVAASAVSNDSLLVTAPAVEVSGSPRRDDTLERSPKRLKVEPSFQPVILESYTSSIRGTESSQVGERKARKKRDAQTAAGEAKEETPDTFVQVGPVVEEEKKHETFENVPISEHDVSGASPKRENIEMEKEASGQPKEEVLELESKPGKPNVNGASLTEFFTPEQVRQHIRGLRPRVSQCKAKAVKKKAKEKTKPGDYCQLCSLERLIFEPPPIYCTPCGSRIKKNAIYYYNAVGGETRHCFCIPCYNESRGETILAEGTSIPKTTLVKRKNYEEVEEAWVQCDKCEGWQHQICALFNKRRNEGEQADYSCPNCYIAEVERNERTPLPESAILGAKDLPRTMLSDHIEQRLFKKLKQERTERANGQAKSFDDEIPAAESLVVRVVSSVDKKLEVKSRFLEIFRDDDFPTEFPYKSKVVLLFQKIEGVEVCLFGMYAQEYGSDCSFPNQRRVYLSYLDSVKYFRPDVRAANGEALRTFVYHEILISYLEYCKKRGFTSCYIWACPPLKGEDYILYCHPEIQKMPKSDKLRDWYLAMLRKAAKEGIVTGITNLYDHFFSQSGECRAKVTAARLPYFDGDYWPGAAEDIINQMSRENDDDDDKKRVVIKKTFRKKALKAPSRSNLPANASKDRLLMQKLGETIQPMKEDFIMVHLQHCCTHCCTLMVSGNRWVCNQCKDFQLCDGCYEAEQNREIREKHPVNQKDKHKLYPIEIIDVPAYTKDMDEILESEFFDTRQAFLSLCQGNHYQYDTLRRAKHSSMMVLYHLHNPTAPAFVASCNACSLDIESGQGWRCEVCPDYDVCNTCYSKEGCINHPHELTNHPSLSDQSGQNKEARQLRVLQLRKMLDLLEHASQCRSSHCQYSNCLKVRGLFQHGFRCKIRLSGGCVLCVRMWHLLKLHARSCKESNCRVPRCGDLKEHVRRLQQQSDSRRRAAVMEMMRQRAAEVGG